MLDVVLGFVAGCVLGGAAVWFIVRALPVREAGRAEQVLRESFAALAAEALKSNSDALLRHVRDQLHGVLAEARGDWQVERERVGKLVEPLGKALEALDRELRAVEQRREGPTRASRNSCASWRRRTVRSRPLPSP